MKKNTALLLLSLPLVAGLLAALWFFGPPLYRQQKVARFQRQAEQALAAQNYRAAWLSAQQTVRLSPTNVVAYRILVDIAGQVQSPAELDLRRRLAELEPTLDNRLLLAATSLRGQRPPYPVAAQIIEELAATASNSPAYRVLAAQLALKLNQLEIAAGHFQQAATIEPTNRLHELNLAVLRLGSSNTTTVASARKTLEVLADDPAHGALALSWLVSDSLRRRDLATATVCSELLLAHPKAALTDRLQHLDILWETPGQPFTNYLTNLQRQAVTNAGQVFQVSTWLLNHGLAPAALSWLQSLPEALRTQQPVPVALADALLAVPDWAGAERFLTVGGPAWGESEYLRLAFWSEVARQLKQTVAAESRWRDAVRDAGDRLGALTDLSNLARDWKLSRERADLLWQIVERFPRQRWALRELDALYQQAKDLRGLSRVYQRLLAYQPQDIMLRNNLAAANLLLNQRVPEASEAAKVLYDALPENPVLASTYAFALHKQGRTRDGLAVLAKLKPEFLNSPGVAVYYAVLLDAVGEKPAALPYAAAARRGDLLPEELQLLTPVDGLRAGDPVPKP
jgi:predicted Zn-dependent protease